MTRGTQLGLVVVSLVLTMRLVAHASSDEPAGINLGGTSFMDGFGRTDPGFVYQQYFQIEHYSSINDQNGHAVPAFQGTCINAVISLNQLIYVSPYHLFGSSLGIDALLPVVDLNAAFAPTSPAKLTPDRGLALGGPTWGVPADAASDAGWTPGLRPAFGIRRDLAERRVQPRRQYQPGLRLLVTQSVLGGDLPADAEYRALDAAALSP
jgi:hypothetical protein